MFENKIKPDIIDKKKYSDFYYTLFGKKVQEKELGILNRELKGCKSVLSVGCGPGIHEVRLVKENADLEIICLDISIKMIKDAMKFSNILELIVGNAEQLPIKNEIFDCVYFVTSFKFIEDSITTLNETSRVLKPGGKALFLISNFKSWYFKKEYAEVNSYFKSKIKHLDNAKLKQAISNKFQIVSINYELGIKGEEVFDTTNPKWASLYVIKAIKVGVPS